MKHFVNINGKLMDASLACITTSNRSFRYGDGCFETLRIHNGKLAWQDLHMERLFLSLELLSFDIPEHFTPAFITAEVEKTLRANKLNDSRVRLSIHRGNGGLWDECNKTPGFVIEPLPIGPVIFEEKGLRIGLFRDGIKVADKFSIIKSGSCLPYAMAVAWCRQHSLDEAILFNPYKTIADATIANVFIVNNGVLCTPPLTDGCVAGIMRRYLLARCRQDGLPVKEISISEEELLEASEVFVTNTIKGIRWVKQVDKSNYGLQLSKYLHHQYIAPLFME